MDQATREVRFAVVLYGGVSLAIYMNGIAQELLHMVRGSADREALGMAEGEEAGTVLSEVELVYRELSKALSGDGRRTRFIIDIISGTSAGGINGVALAKALAIGARNLDVLRKAWAEEAHLDRLLNDGGVLTGIRRTESLLDGRHMYDILLKTLGGMNDRSDQRSLVDETLDLFVTATDLEGRRAPIQLTDKSMDERVHKSVFRFSYIAGDTDEGAPQRNDFGPDSDPMLAFAARCTSSFPVAFPPARLADLPVSLRNRSRDFGDLRKSPEAGADDAFETRLFADGGYLDNRPFSYAIDLIPFRTPSLPGERKLLFVDPFPQKAASAATEADVDFLMNAQLAATTLPRREVIRDDIRDITEMNRRLDRLGALQTRWTHDQAKLDALGSITPHAEKPDDFDNLDLADLIKLDYGRHYPLYHHLRVYGTTDLLAHLVTQIAGYNPESDEWTYLRQVVRAWRDSKFAAYRSKPKDGSDADPRRTENFFLAQFDLDFRLRRLGHLRAAVDAALQSPGQQTERLWEARNLIKRQHWHLRRLRNPDSEARHDLLDAAEIAELTEALSAGYVQVMSQTTLDGRYAEAKVIYQARVRDLVDRFMDRMGENLRKAFDESSEELRGFLKSHDLDPILAVYNSFHWHDNVTFPFLEGQSAQEHSGVQVFRVSPADSALNSDPAKLAGIKVGAFGGFLNQDWREHDILWGRLDGAERIVTALMPRPDQKGEREVFIERLQEAILRDEFEILETGSARRLALVKARLRNARIDDDEAIERLAAGALGETEASAFGLKRFRQYSAIKPGGPSVVEIADWSSRSLRILARMIDGLPKTGFLAFAGPRVAGPLRAGGVLSAQLTHFAMPGSYRNMLARHLLLLVMIAGILWIAVATVSGAVASLVGWLVLGAAVALWSVLAVFGRILRQQSGLSRRVASLVRTAALMLVLLLACVGAWSLWSDWWNPQPTQAPAENSVELATDFDWHRPHPYSTSWWP